MSFQYEENTQINQTRKHGPSEHLGHLMDTPLQSLSKTKKRLYHLNAEAQQHVNKNGHRGKKLPLEVINGVKTFVYFIGYARSGSSIMSSLMDAHQHMIVPYQYGVFKDWSETMEDKNYLFNELYRKSQKDVESGMKSDSACTLTIVRKN